MVLDFISTKFKLWRPLIFFAIGLIGNIFSLYAQAPIKTTIWEQGDDGNFAYFVYGLGVSNKGTILAFTEARIASGADDSAHNLVLKRSVDKGATFSKTTIVVASDGQKSFANPTVLVDRSNGNIFLFYALNHENKSTEVFFISSKDDGLSWSQPTEITPLFANNAHGWTFHLPGPGHGIQLKNKRLIVPIWHRKSISFAAPQRNYGVNCIYSDDHGKTWQLGGDTPVGELNESQVIAQKNGDLLLIGRAINPKKGSYFASVQSKDGGLSWSQTLAYDTALVGPPCDIGLIGIGAKPNYLVVSQPADPKKRKNLTIRLSKDGGKTWPSSKLLQQGAASYSDLAVLPDQSIVCIYGNGGIGHMPKTVSLARFTVDWISQQNP